ncbi:PREDICTED: uncharacterized protein LOC109152802 isoform X1 [Ipomoea nil]|uniref:uncharacterized protein LOC109152802 isoform X1 n=1 Tax=Ipomoea nil TaxID=35883 RepID=UPI000900AE16|nr:PREDICTED: uncharacterized protein LOC109152802 isoform X1 [Ipomoea nil]XP_019155995.1 PREDICTED: uncharacterized protein LOC109152802 isoform X1 [Ipomoea nil]
MVSSNSLRSSSKKSDGKKPTKETGKGNSVSDNNKERGSRKRKIDKVQEKPKPSNKSAKTSTGKASATSQKTKEKANLRPEKTKQKLGSTSKKPPRLKSPKRPLHSRETTSVKEVKEPSARKIKIMQALGLAAPTGSPFQQNPRISSLKRVK